MTQVIFVQCAIRTGESSRMVPTDFQTERQRFYL